MAKNHQVRVANGTAKSRNAIKYYDKTRPQNQITDKIKRTCVTVNG